MVARLIRKDNNEEILCQKNVITIGRAEENDLCLSDPSVSRNHALLRRLDSNDYYLVDTGSTNGSTINGIRCTSPTKLNNKDTLLIGDACLEFICDDIESDIARASNSSGHSITLIGNKIELENITILVADIRDFTSLSEQLPISTLTQLMNQWFDAVNECISKLNGNIDKFIGDCVYARWIADEESPGTVYAALTAAIKLQQLSLAISDNFSDLKAPLNIGVGINTGKAAINIGREATAIGDPVNLAFRLEGQTKNLGKDIIVGKHSYIRLPKKIWQGKEHDISVKGKQDAVSVITLSFQDASNILKDYASS